MTTFSDRISDLTPALMGKARAFATNEFSAEDIFQAIVTTLIEKSNSDPSFVEQGDGYFIRLAEWTARHMNRDDRVYGKYVGQEEITLDDNGDQVSDFELIIDAGSAEDAAQANLEFGEIKQALSGLTAENQKVAYLLFIGYTKAEIADELHISRPAVSQRIQTIQRQLSSFAMQSI